MKAKILKILLWWQGLYYGITGIWAIVSLDSFSRITGHYDTGDAFEMHSIAALAVVLGLAFIWGAMQEKYRVFAGWILFGSAIAIIIPEIVYFSSEVKNTLFLFDLFEETVIAALTLAILSTKSTS